MRNRNLQFIAIAVALAILLSVFPSASSAAVVWSDDFDDEVLDGWTTFGFENITNGLPIDGNFSAEGGQLTAMDDDINSAGALGHLFDLVRVINQSRDAGASAEDLQPAQDMLIELSSVLGLQLEITKQPPGQIDTLVELLIDVRTELRQQKLWELSDMIRDRLAEQDILLEDNKDGTTWRWK